jgi:hypothetical protein
MDKPIAWYDPSNGAVSTDKDSPLFTPLGQVWGLYLKEESSMTKDEALKLALALLELHNTQYPDRVKGYFLDAITAIKEALVQPEQKSVAMADYMALTEKYVALKAAQRKWVGLTNKELADCWETIPELAMRKVEAKLKEKNHG